MILWAYVVCTKCGKRWTVDYVASRTSPPHPRECKNHECDARWLDLSMFMDKADADRVATVAL